MKILLDLCYILLSISQILLIDNLFTFKWHELKKFIVNLIICNILAFLIGIVVIFIDSEKLENPQSNIDIWAIGVIYSLYTYLIPKLVVLCIELFYQIIKKMYNFYLNSMEKYHLKKRKRWKKLQKYY